MYAVGIGLRLLIGLPSQIRLITAQDDADGRSVLDLSQTI